MLRTATEVAQQNVPVKMRAMEVCEAGGKAPRVGLNKCSKRSGRSAATAPRLATAAGIVSSELMTAARLRVDVMRYALARNLKGRQVWQRAGGGAASTPILRPPDARLAGTPRVYAVVSCCVSMAVTAPSARVVWHGV